MYKLSEQRRSIAQHPGDLPGGRSQSVEPCCINVDALDEFGSYPQR